MSLITRQSIKYSVVSYVALFISTFSAIFIYPYNYSFFGYIRFLISTAESLFPVILMGTAVATVRYFPKLNEKNQSLHLFFSALGTLIINTTLIIFLYVFISSLWGKLYIIEEIWDSFPYIIALAFAFGMIQISSKYISNFGRIVVPIFFDNLVSRIALLLSFCAFVFWGMKENTSIILFISFTIGAALGLLIYQSTLQKFELKNPFILFKERSFLKEFYTFGAYSLLGGIGNIIATRIDIMMINEMINDYSTGTYSTILSIIGLIFVPYYALNSIAAPKISELLHNNQLVELKKLYQTSSQNLLLIGSLFLSIIIAGSTSLFHLMHNGQSLLDIYPVLLILGFASLFDMATGFNSLIIAYSRYFRYTLFLTLILAVLTITLNIVFIRYYNLGVVGVAISTCISLVIFNIAKYGFIYRKFKMQPFTIQTVKILLVFFIALFLQYVLPDSSHFEYSLFYKPAMVLIVYYIGNYIGKFIPLHHWKDFNWKKDLMGK